MPRGTPSTSSAPSSVLEEDEAEKAAESSSSKCWPGYPYLVRNSIDCGRLSFQVSRLLESNDNINTFLTSYKHYEPYETHENEDKKLHVMVSNEM